MRLICLLAIGALVGCMTPRKENEIQTDIFNLQTRVLKLEQGVKAAEGDSVQTRKSSSAAVGAMQSEFERMKIEMQKMMGEMDALKVGVQSGEMPGSNEEEDSVSQRIAGLQSRLETIETSQIEILEILENKSSGGSAAKKDHKIESLSGMRKAFNQRRYLHVADVADELMGKFTKKSSKEEGLYLYAESLYKLGRLREAALKYNDFIDSYGSSDKIAHAKLRMGDSFRHLGDTDTARLYYEELVSKYSKTDEATTAKERLERFDKQGATSKRSKNKRG